MKRFKSHKIQVLVATDVAARGIDVNDLTHVFHFNLPDDIEYYTHRSGRTARAGKKGLSIVIISGNEGYRIKALENKLDIKFEHIQVPETADIADTRIQKWCEEILQQDTGRLDGELKNKVNNLFGNLTKEELIAKVLTAQLDLFNLGSSRDINVTLSERSRGGGGRGRDRDRGRSKKWKGSRDRGHGGRDRKSSRDGRSAKSKYGKDRSQRSESSYGKDRSERSESKFDSEKSGRSSFSKRRSKKAGEKSHLKSNGGKATFKLKSKRRKGE
ncbi:UNVERIFIED_CONTAM: hypothetical protein GTU68_044688 [Idotea baltica]|nr:hypothetical protein [Idotea baltica]